MNDHTEEDSGTPLKRERVQFSSASRRPRISTSSRGIPVVRAELPDPNEVYATTLMRTQLRLAVTSVAGFVVVLAAFGIVLATTSFLEGVSLFGVPLSWVIQAYGVYPVIVIFAIVYTRAAARNERRYAALVVRE